MKKKIIIFGASSHLSSILIEQIKKKYEIIAISSKKIDIKKIKFLKTNYNFKSIINFLSLNIKKKDKPIFLFFNSISDENIFIKQDIKSIKKILFVNQTLPIILTNLILKKFFTQKPIFIYMGSSRAQKGDYGITLYSTTKNAISSFVRNMAQEYGKFEVFFRFILLGLFEGGLEKKLNKDSRSKILKRTYNQKYIKINQLIKVIEFAINDTSGNGSELKCDNGYH